MFNLSLNIEFDRITRDTITNAYFVVSAMRLMMITIIEIPYMCKSIMYIYAFD